MAGKVYAALSIMTIRTMAKDCVSSDFQVTEIGKLQLLVCMFFSKAMLPMQHTSKGQCLIVNVGFMLSNYVTLKWLYHCAICPLDKAHNLYYCAYSVALKIFELCILVHIYFI